MVIGLSERPQPQVAGVQCPQALHPEMHECNCVFLLFLSINNKLQQPEAASGVLEYAMKHFGELVSAFSFLLERQEVET